MELTKLSFAALLSFALTVMVMPLFIYYFHAKKRGQAIREDGPTWHNSKSGTPTMGGTVFLLTSVIASIIVGALTEDLSNSLWILLFIFVLYGILGFLDDYIKIFKKRNLGLKASQKLLGQIVGAIIFIFVFNHEKFATVLNLGFIKLDNLIIFSLFVLIWLVGFSNAVNLTDGLDGLATTCTFISFGAYALIAFKQNQPDVLIICLAIMGGLVGFFGFNHKPAKIFMGDVGSLALGGLLAAISILLGHPFSLLGIGIIYVLETASVILQVASFKLTGKRIFKMSPIHHHFEMSGWSEWKIVIVFAAVTLISSILTLVVIL